MYEITLAKNPKFTIPLSRFLGGPYWDRSLEGSEDGNNSNNKYSCFAQGAWDWSDRGGMARDPMKCFKDALETFGRLMNL